ncbi:MAG: cob(I)yrinic acid a,c-diamide adenosyltransferase [Cytophagales bacterium]|nr:cob(I)yrinic acid a,c-diamide adenosyltransferase [Cytophagales bacterium]
MGRKVYTRGGDKGTTGIFGKGRVSKNSVRIECIGTIDEANSIIGYLRAKLGTEHSWQPNLHKIQKDIMDMMSHLARPSDCDKENTNPKPEGGAQFCEEWIEKINESLTTESDYFLLPGGNEISALCHMVRTQLRRAERRIVALMEEDPDCVEDYLLKYVNRLSDLFFVLSREEMDKEGVAEEQWNLFRYKKIKK